LPNKQTNKQTNTKHGSKLYSRQRVSKIIIVSVLYQTSLPSNGLLFMLIDIPSQNLTLDLNICFHVAKLNLPVPKNRRFLLA